MEKLAYIFTNGLYAKLVVLMDHKNEYVDTEYLNEKVLNDVLLPYGFNGCYYTENQLERDNWELDEEGYFYGMLDVYDKNNNKYFLYDDNLIIKFVTDQEIQSWLNNYVTIVELDS